ncbi:hypothetical protein [Cylindrospermum sp. FACHB-282]|uniref:hypothetical protein n=1 Tax=Cylindrospermum sp. FACHB-282 TaxID=2692794 RepID=UPI0016823675|nr:hypothetical protein [Cylindrospermum sp. FACHB-282]MBD2388814.1 hypothetical protein [Cylindrospermum sp. FACHB-282]
MGAENGKNWTSEVWKGDEGGKPEGQPRLMGTLSENSGEYGAYQVGTGREDSSGENLFDRVQSKFDEQGGSTSGKILESLNLIKEAHLSYVHAHRQRLEARLDENKENETDFLRACNLLEQQINNLINDQDSSAGDENQ